MPGYSRTRRGNLYKWLRDTQSVKRGNLMPNVEMTDEDARALVAYLHSLK